MIYTVRMHGIIVGHSDLERRDPSSNAASGIFRPGLGYELVEPIFQLDGERGRQAIEKLALELIDADGHVVLTSRIEIRTRRTLELDVQFVG
ncbi:MAG TPA: hypothetical protein VNW46_03270 [Gemmatimonadaceae bacterium]|jgi:hypothetical protein|nr:hypothetical protein [Gemmatimonadaceae bacterium]